MSYRIIICALVVGVTACATQAPPAQSHVTLLGVSAPERTAGFVAFLLRRSEDPALGTTFMYTPPLDSEPGVSVDVYPVPDSASESHLRDELEKVLASWRRPRPAGPPSEIDPPERLTIVGSDGVGYDGWRSGSRVPGSRSRTVYFFLEKEGHVVRYRFSDDNLDPTLTEARAREFVADFIGALRFRALPEDLRTLPEDTRRVAVRPPEAPPVAPDSLLSQEELERVYDVREAALRWAFENNGSDLEPPAVYCVVVGGPDTDPAESFLARFDDSEVPVRPNSQCGQVEPETLEERRAATRHSIVDPESGRFGLYFHLGRVAWTGERSAEVDVLYLQGGLWGTGWRCAAELSDAGGWSIAECQRTVDI